MFEYFKDHFKNYTTQRNPQTKLIRLQVALIGFIVAICSTFVIIYIRR
jgi:hypothetical protein